MPQQCREEREGERERMASDKKTTTYKKTQHNIFFSAFSRKKISVCLNICFSILSLSLAAFFSVFKDLIDFVCLCQWFLCLKLLLLLLLFDVVVFCVWECYVMFLCVGSGILIGGWWWQRWLPVLMSNGSLARASSSSSSWMFMNCVFVGLNLLAVISKFSPTLYKWKMF